MIKAQLYYCNDYTLEPEKYLSLLPRERAEKFYRLRRETDRKNCVGAYLLLLKGLQEKGIDDFEIVISQNGKPYIKNNPVYFSISHCKNGYVCAISETEIGADIQDIILPGKAMIKKVCSDTEKWAEAGSAEFTRLWTFKESVIKMKGETIGSYKDYVFSDEPDDFYAYGSHFASFVEDESVVTVCGKFDEIEFIKLKSAEL